MGSVFPVRFTIQVCYAFSYLYIKLKLHWKSFFPVALVSLSTILACNYIPIVTKVLFSPQVCLELQAHSLLLLGPLVYISSFWYHNFCRVSCSCDIWLEWEFLCMQWSLPCFTETICNVDIRQINHSAEIASSIVLSDNTCKARIMMHTENGQRDN